MTANRNLSNASEDRPANPDSDLDWLAFQYAAGELHGDELEQFELLLATDERACAALAQAVLLGQAVVQCEGARGEQAAATIVMPYRMGDAAWNSLRPWFRNVAVVCGVGCCVMILGWWRPRVPVETSATASEMATLWIEGADEDQDGDALTPDTHDIADSEIEAGDAVPGWLLAALTHQQQLGDEAEVMND